MEAFLRMFKSRVALDQMSAPKQTTIDRPSYRQAEAVESSHAPEEIFPSRPPPRISRAPSSIASPHLSFPPLSQGTIVTNDITFDPTTTSNTNGGFGDLFVGFHRKQGKVALKRLGVRHNNDKNRRVSSHLYSYSATFLMLRLEFSTSRKKQFCGKPFPTRLSSDFWELSNTKVTRTSFRLSSNMAPCQAIWSRTLTRIDIDW